MGLQAVHYTLYRYQRNRGLGCWCVGQHQARSYWLTQLLRIMMVAVTFVPALGYFNAHWSGTYARVLAPMNAVGLIQLLALGLLGGALLARRLGGRSA